MSEADKREINRLVRLIGQKLEPERSEARPTGRRATWRAP